MGCNSSKAVEERPPMRSVESQLWKEDNLFTRKAEHSMLNPSPPSTERALPLEQAAEPAKQMTLVRDVPQDPPPVGTDTRVMTTVDEPKQVPPKKKAMIQEAVVPDEPSFEEPALVVEDNAMKEPVMEPKEAPEEPAAVPVVAPVVPMPLDEDEKEPVMEEPKPMDEPAPPSEETFPAAVDDGKEKTAIETKAPEPSEETPTVIPVVAPVVPMTMDEEDKQEPVVENEEEPKMTNEPPEPALYPSVQEFILTKEPEAPVVEAAPVVEESPVEEAALYPAVQEFLLTKEPETPVVEAPPVVEESPMEETALYPAVQEFILGKETDEMQQEEEETTEEVEEPVEEEASDEEPPMENSDEPVKAPDPRERFSNKSKVERASVLQLRSRKEVKKNLKLFDPAASDPTVKQQDKDDSSSLQSTIDKFGGNQQVTAVQRRKLELEQKEKENKESADPKSQLKTSWGTACRPGAYKKKVTHKKGPRSKKNLADLP